MTKYFFIAFFILTQQRVSAQEAKLVINRLTGDLYVYTTYQTYQGQRISANAMYLVTNDGVVLFDTPWDSTQYQPLIDSIQARHHSPIRLVMVTHSHEDRAAGLSYFSSYGAMTYASAATNAILKSQGLPTAKYTMPDNNSFAMGQYTFETYYPGHGHTADNIVVWFPAAKVLYGGCFVKSTEATDLGNLSDANPKTWLTAMQQVIKKYGHAHYVISGHQRYGDKAALKHTLKLLKNHR